MNSLQKPMQRGAGILLPVSAIPSPYGIGTFGEKTYEFIDFLEQSGQKYWQVLPLGPTGYGDSPYQSFSAFAGNPYYIDLDILIKQGLLDATQIAQIQWGDAEDWISYEKIYKNRNKVLKQAFQQSTHQNTPAYLRFCADNAFWLEDYCLYTSVKEHFNGTSWWEWEEEIRFRTPAALSKYKELLKEQIAFCSFCQYQFWSQWKALKSYAASKNIEIIGDIPIYVALDSADVWVHTTLFALDKDLNPTSVAGVPPDMFSKTGQLWGNPLYDWDKMALDDFSWWKQRIRRSIALFDILRIDHFIGIVNYYSIPAKDTTAENGKWITGPGQKLITAIRSVMGDKAIIAEDLGIVTEQVRTLLADNGLPGMRLLQFAFDKDAQNMYLPMHYVANTVAYGGTHDNEMLLGFLANQPADIKEYIAKYLGVSGTNEMAAAMIRVAYSSVANTVIFPMQDYLGLDNTGRINTPSTLGYNWCWRMSDGALTTSIAEHLKELTAIYAR